MLFSLLKLTAMKIENIGEFLINQVILFFHYFHFINFNLFFILCRFPYMSCEVICCEIPEILHILVETRDDYYLQKLFSFLEQNPTETLDNNSNTDSMNNNLSKPVELDCYLAGYFEKILEMLFRKMTSQMMIFFNKCGLPLFLQFLQHISSYSIMQIIQRLLLPHLPFAPIENNPDINMDENQNHLLQTNDSFLTPPMIEHCHWSFDSEICALLVDKMLAVNPVLSTNNHTSSLAVFQDAHDAYALHISDMLITVLQLSPPETTLIQLLSYPQQVQRLWYYALVMEDRLIYEDIDYENDDIDNDIDHIEERGNDTYNNTSNNNNNNNNNIALDDSLLSASTNTTTTNNNSNSPKRSPNRLAKKQTVMSAPISTATAAAVTAAAVTAAAVTANSIDDTTQTPPLPPPPSTSFSSSLLLLPTPRPVKQVHLAAAAVLESLISRLFEAAFPLQQGNNNNNNNHENNNSNNYNDPNDHDINNNNPHNEYNDYGNNNNSNNNNNNNNNNNQQDQQQLTEGMLEVQAALNAICQTIAKEFPSLLEYLIMVLDRNPLPSLPATATAGSNSRDDSQVLLPSRPAYPIIRLGQHALSIIKLVEALVRIGHQDIDQAMFVSIIPPTITTTTTTHTSTVPYTYTLLGTCLRLYIHYAENSVLHLSIQRLILSIVESPYPSRYPLQEYLVIQCRMLEILLLILKGAMHMPIHMLPAIMSMTSMTSVSGAETLGDNNNNNNPEPSAPPAPPATLSTNMTTTSNAFDEDDFVVLEVSRTIDATDNNNNNNRPLPSPPTIIPDITINDATTATSTDMQNPQIDELVGYLTQLAISHSNNNNNNNILNKHSSVVGHSLVMMHAFYFLLTGKELMQLLTPHEDTNTQSNNNNNQNNQNNNETAAGTQPSLSNNNSNNSGFERQERASYLRDMIIQHYTLHPPLYYYRPTPSLHHSDNNHQTIVDEFIDFAEMYFLKINNPTPSNTNNNVSSLPVTTTTTTGWSATITPSDNNNNAMMHSLDDDEDDIDRDHGNNNNNDIDHDLPASLQQNQQQVKKKKRSNNNNNNNNDHYNHYNDHYYHRSYPNETRDEDSDEDVEPDEDEFARDYDDIHDDHDHNHDDIHDDTNDVHRMVTSPDDMHDINNNNHHHNMFTTAQLMRIEDDAVDFDFDVSVFLTIYCPSEYYPIL
jgi:hypothetical protein